MQTAYVLKGHISAEGTIVLDEPATLAPGPVLVTLLPVPEPRIQPPAPSQPAGGSSQATRDELWKRLEAIAALPGPPPPDDNLTAKDAETILYGQQNGINDVR